MTAIDLVVLNYNGRRLLEECLPSILHAARCSRQNCRVVVIDNGSSDDSASFLAREYPEVRQFRSPNRGLCSYNEVLARLDSRVVVLLNNDIKLALASVDPLVEPLLVESKCFLTAPLCWLFDGRTYEGLQTAVRWRWGLIQAISDYPGYERVMRTACLTASAGAVMAVDRERFLELGGFDPLYLPGRLEDLDFAFRGYMAGYHARYVPAAVAYHKGEATFRQELGAQRSTALAVRNTLLFHWKNLRHPWHVLRHALALPARVAADCLRAPFVGGGRRFQFSKACFEAVRRWRQRTAMDCLPQRSWRRERAFVAGFDWRQFRAAGSRMPLEFGRPQTTAAGAELNHVCSVAGGAT
ncbi:MAG TPA: glycosyltransferase [Pirellulales bacterium]|jgi:GT2 family glycosyltransferase|nr:glycosyltransferase [Pirellulales bacterium]